ncbi:hypothetical protein ACFYKX_11620 [Cytobacillus sp. FJAT-54145]|uniref:Glycosyltransferase RgtA/B/C/D-like domain-containing protein n=1 Tax=Cytobacillus spartinae TaxID=3299023 RepID=A0ABW6KAK2_9BACI
MRLPQSNLTLPSWLFYSFAMVIILLLFGRLTPAYAIFNSDMYFHLGIGEWMLDHRQIPTYAINSFDPSLPYVTHEIWFQWALAWLYQKGGWNLVHLASSLCLFFTVYAMVRLLQEGRETKDLTGMDVFILLLLLLPMMMMFFSIRPQIVSAPLIVWAFVWMVRFTKKPRMWRALILVGSSFVLANVHGGVWPVLFVLWGIVVAAYVYQEKRLPLSFVILSISQFGVALFNPGGLENILYILLVGGDPRVAEWNEEWKPLVYTSHPTLLLVFLLFLFCVFLMKRNPLSLFLALGIGTLAVSGFKQAHFLFLFLPFFWGLVPNTNLLRFSLSFSRFLLLFTLGVVAYAGAGILPEKAEANPNYPVEEMAYVNQHYHQPKVLADFNVSSYILQQGGSVLADGRWDPFQQDESRKGSRNFTALERSYYITKGHLPILLEEISLSHPDVLLLPHNPDGTRPFEEEAITKRFGEPVFEGTWGKVWDVKEETP